MLQVWFWSSLTGLSMSFFFLSLSCRHLFNQDKSIKNKLFVMIAWQEARLLFLRKKKTKKMNKRSRWLSKVKLKLQRHTRIETKNEILFKKVISSAQMKPKAMKDLCTQRCHSSRLADRLSLCVYLNIFVWIFGRDRNENVHIKPLLFFYLVFEIHCIERQQRAETQRNPGRFYLLVFGIKTNLSHFFLFLLDLRVRYFWLKTLFLFFLAFIFYLALFPWKQKDIRWKSHRFIIIT